MIQYVYTALKLCYVHPDGVESQSVLQLRICDGSEKRKEVLIEPAKTEDSFKVYIYTQIIGFSHTC